MTDATKNKASFIAYNNNTLLQQKNFMSTKRTLSEHINQKKYIYITNVYIILYSESLFPHLHGAQYATLLFPSIFKYVLREGMHYNPVRQNTPFLSKTPSENPENFPFVLFIFDHLTCSGFQYMHCRMSCASKDGWVNLPQTQILRNVFLSGNMLVTRSNEISFTL